jgi:hypothetical protein
VSPLRPKLRLGPREYSSAAFRKRSTNHLNASARLFVRLLPQIPLLHGCEGYAEQYEVMISELSPTWRVSRDPFDGRKSV